MNDHLPVCGDVLEHVLIDGARVEAAEPRDEVQHRVLAWLHRVVHCNTYIYIYIYVCLYRI